MSEKKKYQVSIFGENYLLLSDEPESRVLESAELVDTLMKEIAGKLGVSGARDAGARQCAILVALRVASKLLSIESDQARTHMRHEDLVLLVERAFSSF